ncbi:hypothetical protein ACFX19_020975 [Malus domestica]
MLAARRLLGWRRCSLRGDSAKGYACCKAARLVVFLIATNLGIANGGCYGRRSKSKTTELSHPPQNLDSAAIILSGSAMQARPIE